MTFTRALALALALALPNIAWGAISLAIAPSYDDVLYSLYPTGDKPQAGCVNVTTYSWTEANSGDAAGEICAPSSSNFTFAVSGSSSAGNHHYAYKDCGGSDCQIEARVLDTYAGASSANAAIGVGIRESAATSSYLAQCESPQAGSSAVRCKYGSNSSYTTVEGPGGLARPICVQITYDLSSTTIKGFYNTSATCAGAGVEIFSVVHALSNDLVYTFGASQSTTQTLAAEQTNLGIVTTIDAYTPSDPPVGAPTLVSPIPDQTGTQGSAFSLTFSSYFTGATSYSVSGLPGSSGLSESSDGVLSGTPAAADVSASPYALTLRATNAGGNTDDIAAFTFSSSSGTTHVSGDVGDSTKTTIDCDTFDGGVDPGDTIELTSGSRGAVEIRDCHGNASNPIRVRKSASATRLTITGSGGGADAFLLRNSTYVDIDFTVNWTSHTGGCGVDASRSETPKTDCGLLIDATNQYGIKCRGQCMFNTWKGIEVDGNWPVTATATGIDNAFSPNDQDYCVSQVPTYLNREFREQLNVSENYFHHVSQEALYFGPNVNNGNCTGTTGVPRLKDTTIANNFIQYAGWDGIELKSAIAGTNLIEGNVVLDIGAGAVSSGANSRGISFFESGGIARYNRIGRTFDPPGGAAGLVCSSNNGFTYLAAFDCQFYGNLIYDTDGQGINFTESGSTDTGMGGDVYNNTVIDAGGCINVSSEIDEGGIVRDNICAGNTSISLSGAGWSQTNNRTGTVAAQSFENAAGDDYRLTSGSGARNSGTANCPSEDILGVSRPQGGTCDQGAYEFDE